MTASKDGFPVITVGFDVDSEVYPLVRGRTTHRVAPWEVHVSICNGGVMSVSVEGQGFRKDGSEAARRGTAYWPAEGGGPCGPMPSWIRQYIDRAVTRAVELTRSAVMQKTETGAWAPRRWW